MAVRRPRPAGDDLVMLYVDWTIEMKGPDRAPITRTGQGLDVLRRQRDGAWLSVLDDAFTRG